MGLLKALFGDYSKKEIKRIKPTVNRVLELEETYSQMADEELKRQTQVLKDRLAKGETTDDILPDAFAVCREAAWRVLGMKHFPVQVMGGIILHQGRISEMRTGEGKTLVATLPAYLNGLTGKGVHVVTVNDYLARRDSEWMGKLYRYLGLTVGLIVHDLRPEERKSAYAADITYGTNNELGFDYLRDNMVVYKDQKVQRGHNFAIVDEVDSILIDEARTPLIISGPGDKSSDLYQRADVLARTLKKKVFKEIDAKEDSSFFRDDPPRHSDDLVGDQVYMSPEACLFICGEPAELTCKMDVFGLGILFHQYLTGTLPSFDTREYDYAFDYVLDGYKLGVSTEIPSEIRAVISSMLASERSRYTSLETKTPSLIVVSITGCLPLRMTISSPPFTSGFT